MKTWLLIDANYLCHRAWYSRGSLSFGDVFTGATYGFLQDIVNLQETLGTKRMAFCFDCGTPLRKRDYPEYKSNRTYNEEEAAMKEHLDKQIKALRKEHLRGLGYHNVFYQKGYEADDIIAQLANHISADHSGKVRGIIISADHDMYQLLGPNISIYSPRDRKSITADSFSREYGVSPYQWIDVKAIAGCSSDAIQGVKGVGEKTAAKFLNGTLKPTSKAFQAIASKSGNRIWNSNRHLVKLPYPGVKEFELVPDKVDAQSWEALADKLGMKSIRGAIADRQRKRGKGFGVY